MQCANISFNGGHITNGTVCAASQSGYIAVTVKNLVNAQSSQFPFTAYLDVWHTGSGWSGWSEIGSRSGTSKYNGTNVSFSPTYGATKTYRVRCKAHPDNSDNFEFTTANFCHYD